MNFALRVNPLTHLAPKRITKFTACSIPSSILPTSIWWPCQTVCSFIPLYQSNTVILYDRDQGRRAGSRGQWARVKYLAFHPPCWLLCQIDGGTILPSLYWLSAFSLKSTPMLVSIYLQQRVDTCRMILFSFLPSLLDQIIIRAISLFPHCPILSSYPNTPLPLPCHSSVSS